MEDTRKPSLTWYISVLLRWKKFIIINLLVVLLITVPIVFLVMKNHYKATTTIMMPPEGGLGLGGLTSLIGGSKSGTSALGAKLLGISSGSEDVLLGILNSRSTLVKVINKFNLLEYYEITENNIDKALKAFAGDINFETNEYGMIEISIVNKDPHTAAKIANYMVTILDSTNIALNTANAANNRKFIEQRYFQNLDDLKKAEESMYAFQKKYGIVAVPEQLEVSIKVAAELEGQLMAKEIALQIVKQQLGENTPKYVQLKQEVELLRQKVLALKDSDRGNLKSNVLYPFKDLPDISIEYLRLFREIEIQQKLLEITLPFYEQAKVEEQKSIPTVMVLDKAVPPILKDSPKRAFLLAGVFSVFLFLLIPLCFISEKFRSVENPENEFEKILVRFSKFISTLYRIR